MLCYQTKNCSHSLPKDNFNTVFNNCFALKAFEDSCYLEQIHKVRSNVAPSLLGLLAIKRRRLEDLKYLTIVLVYSQ